MELKLPEEWGKLYAENKKLYDDFTQELHSHIFKLLKHYKIDFDQIESRTKEVGCFIDKIIRDGKDYKYPLIDITDIVGVRIIAYYLEDVDKIGEIIKNEFNIDFGNSVDKAQTLDPDRFGYLSIHYIVSLPSKLYNIVPWIKFKDFKAEIQIRTVLQHAWAAINHKLVYKTAKEAPKKLRRQLFRLSALLELADEEFSSLKELNKEIEKYYSIELKKGIPDIDIDQMSLHIYLYSSKELIKWQELAIQIGFEIIPIGMLKEDLHSGFDTRVSERLLVKLFNVLEIKTIKDLDEILNQAWKWGEKALKIFQDNYNIKFRAPMTAYYIIFIIILFSFWQKLDKEKLVNIGIRSELIDFIAEEHKIIK